MSRRMLWIRCGIPVLLVAGGLLGVGRAQSQTDRPSAPAEAPGRDAVNRFVERYCIDCHNGEDKTADLDLDAISTEDLDRHPEAWEKVVRKLVARQMPPARMRRPQEAAYDSVVAS